MGYIGKFFIISLITFGCTKDESQNLPQINTTEATNILLDKATLNGEVINDGTTLTKERGFVYSNTNSIPNINDNKSIAGSGKGTYSLVITNLLINTKYYFRTYATNNQGTAYGNTLYFVTADYKTPNVTTGALQNLASYSVTLTGSVIDDGGTVITERGFNLLEYNGTALKSSSVIQVGSGIGDFVKSMSTLLANTKYSFKAYAKNSKGTTFGSEVIFTTLPEPSLTTVVSKTGRIWLDKNLGASSVATSISDSKAFGYFYQWGRNSDGHQLRDSPLTLSLSVSKSSAGNSFILSPVSNGDWLVNQDDNLWVGTSGGINNVCPIGFRIPTIDEWKAEIDSWNSKDAYNSPLKLPLAGYRGSNKGDVLDEGNIGFYWSSSPSPYGKTAYGIGFTSVGSGTDIGFTARARGASVRCIKE